VDREHPAINRCGTCRRHRLRSSQPSRNKIQVQRATQGNDAAKIDVCVSGVSKFLCGSVDDYLPRSSSLTLFYRTGDLVGALTDNSCPSARRERRPLLWWAVNLCIIHLLSNSQQPFHPSATPSRPSTTCVHVSQPRSRTSLTYPLNSPPETAYVWTVSLRYRISGVPSGYRKLRVFRYLIRGR
jgi:hypothetical protein